MKQCVRFVLTLVLCLALSISGMLAGVPAIRVARTSIWTATNTDLAEPSISFPWRTS